MALDVTRLRDSDLALLATGDEFKAAVLLWCVSWLQVPAASLPDDDVRLGKFTGLDPKAWKKVRPGALRGWVKCTDGRLYHPVVAEKALEAWDRRGDWEEAHDNKKTRQQRWRERCKALAQQLREAGVTPPAGASLTVLEEMVGSLRDVDASVDAERLHETQRETSPVDAREMPLIGIGTETGTDKGSVPDGTGDEASPAAPPDPLASLRALDEKTGAWRLALKVLMDRGGYSEARARPLVGKWSKEHSDPALLWRAAEAAWTAGTLDPVSYITAALERMSAEDDNPLLRPTEVRQRAWMQDYTAAPDAWREHERGPRPGEPGCRVAPEIQREFGIEPAPLRAVGGA